MTASINMWRQAPLCIHTRFRICSMTIRGGIYRKRTKPSASLPPFTGPGRTWTATTWACAITAGISRGNPLGPDKPGSLRGMTCGPFWKPRLWCCPGSAAIGLKPTIPSTSTPTTNRIWTQPGKSWKGLLRNTFRPSTAAWRKYRAIASICSSCARTLRMLIAGGCLAFSSGWKRSWIYQGMMPKIAGCSAMWRNGSSTPG